LVVASPHPIIATTMHRQEYPQVRWPRINAVHCVLDHPAGELGFCCIHLRTPRDGLSRVLDRSTVVDPAQAPALERDIALRRLECEQLVEWFEQFEQPLIIAGDFNMPSDSAIYRQTWSRLGNAFARAGFGFGYTKITPVIGIEFGLRIDHVLFDEHWAPTRAWVGEDVGSDHLPVVAKLVPREP
jgi:endonuclease/exonuclease/phosphatase (EEP) superfamily protein YafD